MAAIIGFFNNFLGGAIFAFILTNLINLIELGAILKVMRQVELQNKDMQEMLKQFKLEGEDSKWLK
jgi:hypothetical protein